MKKSIAKKIATARTAKKSPSSAPPKQRTGKLVRAHEQTAIGELIKQTRLRRDLEVRPAAAELGISDAYWYLIEKGDRRLDLERIPRLAEILGLDPRTFTKLALLEWAPSAYRAAFGDREITKQTVFRASGHSA